jgi:phosphoserine aminotransferase
MLFNTCKILNINIIVRVFKLLRKTGGGTACKELPQACFKLITTIIRDYSDFNISAEHIEVRLLIGFNSTYIYYN